MDEKLIEEICRVFQIKGEYRSCELITFGHINTTYKVYFFRGGEIKDYILQRVNTYVFKDPVGMMHNITSSPSISGRRSSGRARKRAFCIISNRGRKYYTVVTAAFGAAAAISTIPNPFS
ncbi:MAG: hypothetical protein ACLS4Z_11725 [Christensenellaceae bacterium]